MVRDGVHTCDISNQIEVTFWNSLDNTPTHQRVGGFPPLPTTTKGTLSEA
jgi:hypothetical protein